ncbi:MAG: ABC transporter ATP-binding protein [Lachnospiraceae bacterium]
MLRVHNLEKKVQNRKILQGISFTVQKNEILGLIGPKGAGKTTLVKVLASLINSFSGSIFIDEIEMDTKSAIYKNQIGYMPEDFLVYSNLKVGEYMEFYASLYSVSKKQAKERIKFLLEIMGLTEKEDQYIDSLTKIMRKKLSLARCLVHDPKILILDEPTEGMELTDRYEILELLSQIANMGKSIIVTSPIISEISSFCSSIGIIHEGKMLLSGTVEEIQNQVRTEKPIIIKTLSENETELAVTVLKKNNLIERISLKNREIRVVFSGKPEEENELLTDLINQGVRVQSFSREEGSLEHLFLELMKENEDAF